MKIPPIYTWQMKILGFRAREKYLIQGKILPECKCISKCFNNEVDFFNNPKGKASKILSCG
jgi:hypothetical protein